jgi:hypothetical protein
MSIKYPYTLKPLESILINKLMPKGYKLELEENISLSAPLTSKTTKEHKAIPETIQSKCELFLKKILNHEIAQEFYIRKDKKEPSIINIEKDIKNEKYKNIFDLTIEFRKLWKYYLNNYKTEREIISKASRMSDYTEKINKNFESPSTSIGSTIENLEKALKVINDNPMTLDEKKMLGKNIKLLNQDQLRGIVKIIQNNSQRDKKEKYLEFNIDKLSIRKCRELESYVRSCLGIRYIETKHISINNSNSIDEKNSEISESSSQPESW